MRSVKEAINWNTLDDDLDKVVFEKLKVQFWVPEKFAVANDLASWRTLTANEKQLVMRVFAGLTLLDTLQGSVGAVSMLKDVQTDHEEAVLLLIAFMEHIHAQSYSYIFQTLAGTPEINEAFRWSRENEWLQNKARIIQEIYEEEDPHKKKIASVLLESFLFYSGFYLPLYLNGNAKLTNTADVIKFIIRDEAIHGYYIGYKLQKQMQDLSPKKREDLTDWAYELLDRLYENEVRYTQDLYDGLGLTEDVKSFIRYNGNKALMNMGMEPLFPKEEINPMILNGLSLGGETHDFFSSQGNYVIAKSRQMTFDDFTSIEAMI